MSVSDLDLCMPRIIAHEGTKYTNNPKDPGGPTKYGITLATYRRYLNPSATPADIQKMTLAIADHIYELEYWNALDCNALPPGIDYTVMDYGVNSGIGRAGRVLRQVVGMSTATWRISPDVIAAINDRDVDAVITAVNNERLQFLHGLKTWSVFGNGWTTRVREVAAYSSQLAALRAPAPSPTPAPNEDDSSEPVPLPPVPATPPSVTAPTGKGTIPEVTQKKRGIFGTALAAMVGAFAGFKDWVAANPGESALLAGLFIAAVTAILVGIHVVHISKQTTPVKTGVVPKLGAVS